MKKTVKTSVVGMMMAATLVAPVHAADVANPTGTMEVEYKQASSWIVSIPKTTLSATEKIEQSVKVNSINMRPEQKLQVKITGITDGVLTLTRKNDIMSPTTTTTITISTDEAGINLIDENTVIAEYENQSNKPINNTTGKLYFSAIPKDTKAGDYTGTVTYTMTAV